MLTFIRFALVFLTVFTVLPFCAQDLHTIADRDTLRLTFRSGGELDSVDLYLFPNLTTLPGGYSGFQLGLPNDLFIRHSNGRYDGEEMSFSKMKFSALPHIGFAYTFGSKGTQGVKARYEQFFGKHTLLNVYFNQLRSNSFMRNGQYAFNEVGAQLNHARNRFIFQLNTVFKSSVKSQNGGLVSDSLIDQFALEFLNTNKTSAESSSKKLKLVASSMVDFTKDTLVSSGLFMDNGIGVKNYRYTETGDLSSLYSVINYDSLSTSDQFQQSTLSNGVGYYHLGKVSQFKAGLHLDYWKVFNLSRAFDTTEVRISGEWKTRIKKLDTYIYYENRLVGANNSQSGRAEVFTNISPRLKLNVTAFYSNQLPDQFVRYHLGNTILPVSDWKNEKRWSGSVGIVLDVNPTTSLNVNYTSQFVKDNYFFVNGVWSNSTLYNFQLHQARIGGEWRFSSLSVRPTYRFTYSTSEFTPFPTHRLDCRIVLSGFLFKAKKLKAYSGVDVQVQSSIRPTVYISMIDAFSLTEQVNATGDVFNLHAFAGFQIDQFRFFLRLENIGYFWNDRSVELAQGYPFSPFQFRVGITWDFFN